MKKMTFNKIGKKMIAYTMAVITLSTTALVMTKQVHGEKQDISTHWAASSISFVQERGLYLGVDNNNFMPDKPMTRELLVTAVARLDGSNSVGTNNFVDVDASSMYAPYIGWAAKNGIVNGVGNQKFAPQNSITREQLAVVFTNYLKYKNILLPTDDRAEKFADNAKISNWANKAVYEIREMGIISGKGNNIFDPQGLATRAEVATMLDRLYHSYIDVKVPGNVGAYTEERNVTKEDRQVFKEATQKLTGVSYEPLRVATQVVAGTNYKFYVKATTVTANPVTYNTYVYIYKPLNGAATVTSIDEVNIPETNKPGAYTEERNVTNEDRQVFKEATQKSTGVNYEPLKVATQVVAGTNYKFYVKATTVTANPVTYNTYVYIFKPLNGAATVTSIDEVEIPDNNKTGGYSEERNITNEDRQVFKEATQKLMGVNYEPLKVATQVVAGTNYKFYVKATPVTANPTSYFTYVYINKPLNGTATVTSIDDVTVPENPIAGGYSEERDLTAKDLEIFKKATKDIVGVTYEPIKVSTQVVNGTNYKFSVKVTPVVPDGYPNVGYVFINVPLNGEPQLERIERPQY